MNRTLPTRPLALAAALAAVSPALAHGQATAASEAEILRLQAEVAAMRAEMDAMKAGDATWMDADREAQTRRVVEEAIAEADVTAGNTGAGGAVEGGMSAGYNGKKFVLEGEGYTMEIGGQLQFRYAFNRDAGRDAGTGDASDLDGFEMRRTKLGFEGTLLDPDLEYTLVFAAPRNGGDFFIEDAIIGYTFENGVGLQAGLFKLPFAFEELLSSKRQLAADRGLSTEFFTLNRAEQVQLSVPVADVAKTYLSFSDGGNRANTGALNDATDYALTGRAQFRLAGDWGQVKDLVAFEDEFALFAGVAGHVEKAKDQGGLDGDTTFAYTGDAVMKVQNLALMGAFYGASADDADLNQLGFLAQAGYNLTEKLQPFARYDFVDNDVTDVSAVTAGFNYFFNGHKAKFTLDGIYVIEPDGDVDAGALGGLNGGTYSSGLGLDDDGLNGDDSMFAVRAQFQLLF
ncbi:phosphate porin [Phycisphaera mikurensis]|uniref:Phosphate-selective porin O/P family protein n=1 Tax=Phycisphaera mikurensis (strain NBRC 102666 / KCTC 22515 / FYK2301M01) TaxID=1142394 RepID=I0IHZ5_PHYMF|nr:phosphate porin [Phycisphaera mikurensis]MBB6442553.1 hypothetical protein [Phycisphaera mikurensis]BAM04883.1 phosphate-selective porin O/P family protein [Phycisphaera mikurensis NBRC 102666]